MASRGACVLWAVISRFIGGGRGPQLYMQLRTSPDVYFTLRLALVFLYAMIIDAVGKPQGRIAQRCGLLWLKDSLSQ